MWFSLGHLLYSIGLLIIKKKYQPYRSISLKMHCEKEVVNLFFFIFNFFGRSPPVMLMKVIEDGAAAMDIILSDVDIETCVAMVPGTEEYQFALGYLLAWQLALIFFHSASSEVSA